MKLQEVPGFQQFFPAEGLPAYLLAGVGVSASVLVAVLLYRRQQQTSERYFEFPPHQPEKDVTAASNQAFRSLLELTKQDELGEY